MIAGRHSMVITRGGSDGAPWDWDYSSNLATRNSFASQLSRVSIPTVTALSLPSGVTFRQSPFVVPGKRATLAAIFSFNGSNTQSELCLWDVETGSVKQTGVTFTITSSASGVWGEPLQDGTYLFVPQNGKKIVRVSSDFRLIGETSMPSMMSAPSRMSALLNGQVMMFTNGQSDGCLINVDTNTFVKSFSGGGSKISSSASPDGGFVTTNYSGGVNVWNSSATSIRNATGSSYYGFRFTMWPSSHSREVFFGLSGHNPNNRVGMNIDTLAWRTTSSGGAIDSSAGAPCWLPSGEAFIPEPYNSSTGANRFSVYDYATDSYSIVHTLTGTSAKYFSARTLPCGKVVAWAGTDILLFNFGYSLSDLLPGSLFTSPFGFNQNRGV